jgi:hypothetical protein
MEQHIIGRHDVQHNDIRHNDTQHNGLVCDTNNGRISTVNRALDGSTYPG